tara:strand:+ start:592 stop:1026 length:435 start_codon:yes stop_codon:yes gene_type:complete
MEIKFSGPYGVKNTTTSNKVKKKASSGGFQTHVESSSKLVEGAILPSVPSALMPDGLTDIQEVEPKNKERKRAAKQGGQLLDELKKWQKKLLCGAFSEADLVAIDEILKEIKRKPFHSQELQEIVSQIELRAAVEIAKIKRDYF